MKPHEYVANAKSADTKAPLLRASIPELLAADLQKSGHNVENLLAKIGQIDYAQFLVSHLQPRLPAELRDLIDQGIMAFGEVSDPTPNAYVKKLDDEGYAIIFHSGLRDFIYRVARVLATRFTPHPCDNEAESAVSPVSETARLVADVFWWFQETGQAFGPEYPISPDQIKIASWLALEAETFLLAHEIGHVIDDASAHGNPAFEKFDVLIPSHHRDEYAADAFGLALVLELHNQEAERNAFQTQIIYAGAEFTLQIYGVLERLGLKFADSHPAATARLEVIRSEMRKRYDSDVSWNSLISLSSAIDEIFRLITGIIENPREHENFYEQQAHQIMSDLDQLMTKCIGGLVPDYFSFYNEAGQIFARGYSHAVLERAAHIAAEFFDIREGARYRSVGRREAESRFQKFKLLLGFIDHMCEPARSLFLAAFDAQS